MTEPGESPKAANVDGSCDDGERENEYVYCMCGLDFNRRTYHWKRLEEFRGREVRCFPLERLGQHLTSGPNG